MTQTRVKPMVEGGILSAIAIIFALISAYIPVVGVFTGIFWPVPIILLGVRHGYKWSMMATVVAGIISALLTGPLHALSVVLGFGLIGIALGHGFRKGYSPVKTLLWGVGASIISKLMLMGIGAVFMGVNPLNFEGEGFEQAMEQAINIYRSIGMSEQDLTKIAAEMKELFKLMKVMVPVIIALGAVFDTYINFVAARAVLKRMGKSIASVPIESFPPLKSWNMPRATVYVWGLSIAGLLFSQGNPQYQIIYQLAVNLQLAAMLILLVQGLALGYFLADKYEIPKLIRTILLVLIFTNGLFGQIVIFAGVFDLILDYRRLRTPRQF